MALVVKNFDNLVNKHGFIHTVGKTYYKNLDTDEEVNGLQVSLTVNPLCEDTKDRMVVEVSFDYGDEEVNFDVLTELDIVFEMVADGTVEYVKEEK